MFRITVLRSILDKLIYLDEYGSIDQNLTDANVGGRKGRNIRDNIFVMSAVTNSILNGTEEPCDFGEYDIKQCLHSLWP